MSGFSAFAGPPSIAASAIAIEARVINIDPRKIIDLPRARNDYVPRSLEFFVCKIHTVGFRAPLARRSIHICNGV
jgi:hypothetical protein